MYESKSSQSTIPFPSKSPSRETVDVDTTISEILTVPSRAVGDEREIVMSEPAGINPVPTGNANVSVGLFSSSAMKSNELPPSIAMVTVPSSSEAKSISVMITS